MYSILISSVAALLAFFLLHSTNTSNWGWAFFFAVIAFVGSMAVVSHFIRKRIGAVMMDIQMMMEQGQKDLMRQMNAFRARPQGDPMRFQKKLMDEQRALCAKAVVMTDALNPYRNWIPFFGRQTNTTRMQFYYQMRDFKKVDALLPNCLVIDPITASMKLARMVSNNAPLEQMEKTFRRARSRARYDQSVLLASLMAWIYVREKKIDEAIAVLDKAVKTNHIEENGPSGTITRNLEMLRNNRVRDFSNAGLGEQWYMLMLEEPKIRYERQTRPPRYGRF